MKRFIHLTLFVFVFLPLRSEVPVKISGTIVEYGTNGPVGGVIVRAGKSFASSDVNGSFSITLASAADSVSFRCMGYETLTLPAKADFSKVEMHVKETVLQDVIIEAPDIYAKGDTLVFNVSRYAKPEDNAIIDVLKRLPGIKVEDDGTIKYQGKPINKFYLDGNDFIGGQYGLATNNISYKDVASVEVMENHQPVKALEGIEFPEEAGINLKLKEDARIHPVGVTQGTLGATPLLYDASLFTVSLAKKLQSMVTLKADNTGWDPESQITEHDFNDMFSSTHYMEQLWPDYISADAVSTPLSKKRTRDNQSYLANGIAAWKSGDTSMRLKVNYIGDRLDYSSGVTTHYLNSDIPSFVENNEMCTHRHDLSAQYNAEVNKRDYYLKDKVLVDAAWDRSSSAISGSYDISQRVRRNTLSAVNDLKLVKRKEKKVFTLTSRNSFLQSPDRLFIRGEKAAQQRITSSDFRSTTETKFGKLTRFWKYYLETGVDLNYHHSNLHLTGLTPYDNHEVYDAFLSIVYATPRIEYERHNWRLSYEVPLRWQHQSLNGKRDFLHILPSFHARKQCTSKSDISATVHYHLLSSMAYLFMDNAILQDFRNIFIATGNDQYTQSVSASASYRYRNPLNALFFNLSGSYLYSRNPLMSNETFVDNLIVSTYALHLSSSRTYQAKGELSKGLAHSRIVIGCETGYAYSSASSMRNGNVMNYNSKNLSLRPYFRGSLTKWLSMNYEATYGFSCLEIDADKKASHSFRQDLAFTAYPHDRIQLILGSEHYLTRFPEGNHANLVLVDGSITWQTNGKLRLSLSANNLLGKRNYRYITYGTLSSSEHWFRIRPRSILASLQYRF